MVLLSAVVELDLLNLSGQFHSLLWRNTLVNKIKDNLFKCHIKAGPTAGSYLDCFKAFGLYGEHGKFLVLPKSLVYLFEVHHVVRAYEQQAETLFGSSCCSATPMDVSLRCPGNLMSTKEHY